MSGLVGISQKYFTTSFSVISSSFRKEIFRKEMLKILRREPAVDVKRGNTITIFYTSCSAFKPSFSEQEYLRASASKL